MKERVRASKNKDAFPFREFLLKCRTVSTE